MKAAFVALAFCMTGMTGPGPAPSGECAGVRLEISADALTVKAGDAPAIRARLVNSADMPVLLVRPGDGSDAGWRTPVIGWSAIRADDPSARHSTGPPPTRGARDGNINPLTAKDLIALKPGQAEALGSWTGGLTFPAPGSYKVVLHYRNDPALVWKGIPLGSHDAAAMERVKRSAPCSLVSNELTFQVTR